MLRTRRLAARDYHAVKKIEKVVVDEYLRYLEETREQDSIEPWITREYLNHYVRTKNSYVAELERKVVGFILGQPVSHIQSGKKGIWLEYIAVLPESRKKGIGTMLMLKAIEAAKTHDVHLLYTTLNPNNDASIRFLKKNGFKVTNWMEASRKLTG